MRHIPCLQEAIFITSSISDPAHDTALLLRYAQRRFLPHRQDLQSFWRPSESDYIRAYSDAMSLLQQEVVPIREIIYDTGLDGIKELKDHLADKYGKDNNMKVNAKASNFINWLILKLPLKNELKHYRLIY